MKDPLLNLDPPKRVQGIGFRTRKTPRLPSLSRVRQHSGCYCNCVTCGAQVKSSLSCSLLLLPCNLNTCLNNLKQLETT